MKIKPKKLACVFAHPDDEAFGPGGSIAYFATKCEVYVVCVTNGDMDKKFAKGHKVKSLGKIRRQELKNSAKILGVKSVTFLGFKDGSLNNNNYHYVTKKLKNILTKLKPDTLMTFNTDGVSGHLDHTAVSMETSYLFERLSFIKTLMYFCEKSEIKDIIGSRYFVYFPRGYKRNEVDLIVNVEPYLKTKIRAMRAHKSQKSDAEMIIGGFKNFLKEEYFKVLKK